MALPEKYWFYRNQSEEVLHKMAIYRQAVNEGKVDDSGVVVRDKVRTASLEASAYIDMAREIREEARGS